MFRLGFICFICFMFHLFYLFRGSHLFRLVFILFSKVADIKSEFSKIWTYTSCIPRERCVVHDHWKLVDICFVLYVCVIGMWSQLWVVAFVRIIPGHKWYPRSSFVAIFEMNYNAQKFPLNFNIFGITRFRQVIHTC